MSDTTMTMTAGEAGADGAGGFLVLNGSADGPATTTLRDPAGADVKATTADEALRALQGRFNHVELLDHTFPDASGEGVHRMKVWVPR